MVNGVPESATASYVSRINGLFHYVDEEGESPPEGQQSLVIASSPLLHT